MSFLVCRNLRDDKAIHVNFTIKINLIFSVFTLSDLNIGQK